MQIDLPESTIRDVNSFLDAHGRPCDIVTFVDQSVQRALFFGVVGQIHRRNVGVDSRDIEQCIDDAVDAARSGERD